MGEGKLKRHGGFASDLLCTLQSLNTGYHTTYITKRFHESGKAGPRTGSAFATHPLCFCLSLSVFFVFFFFPLSTSDAVGWPDPESKRFVCWRLVRVINGTTHSVTCQSSSMQ